MTAGEAGILARLQPCRKLVEAELSRVLPRATRAPVRLHRAMRYAALGPGKRLRPMLTVLVARMFGVAPRRSAPYAVAFELLHTYSLIHDDLPCMDDDDYRRGRLTCHKKFGEATAVLAGDALLTLAFGTLTDRAIEANLPARRTVQLVSELARAAGSQGLIFGQIDDLEAEGKRVSLKRLASIHDRKTGRLFTVALRAGAILGGADRRELEVITRYGDLFGQVFQITDDILDVTGSFEEIGKPVGSDRKNEKATYVSLLSVDRARAIARALCRRAVRTIRRLRGRPVEPLVDLVEYLPGRIS
ncbi:MAG: polyprenyl synthetase family protein [Candidatus Riflebacteria bacterium]|nr:polyprenyl synthetase family protein [Candidatus Riflebacteria bacterium]